jgi:hypothetical protein
MFVDLGSTINLTCVARFTPGQPEYVKWLHGNKVTAHEQLASQSTSSGSTAIR